MHTLQKNITNKVRSQVDDIGQNRKTGRSIVSKKEFDDS